MEITEQHEAAIADLCTSVLRRMKSSNSISIQAGKRTGSFDTYAQC